MTQYPIKESEIIVFDNNCMVNKRKINANDAQNYHKHPAVQWPQMRFMTWLCLMAFQQTLVCLSVLCRVVDVWVYCGGSILAPQLYCDIHGQGQR